MIHRDFVEPADPAWQQWRTKAEAATQRLILRAAAGEAVKNTDINDELYKGGRDAIWKTFHGKCAYCEAKFILDQTGDVEHFRPKLGVRDENDRPVNHPGYYWLAYDWRNLLPSCAKCNRLSKTSDGKLIGKGERFPVDGSRAVRPGDEATEAPLFLHPVFDDPDQHLLFDVTTGVLSWRTKRGEATVKLLGLNREGLPEERKKVYISVTGIISAMFGALTNQNVAAAANHLKLLDAYRQGEEAYSLPGRRAIADQSDSLKPLVEFLVKISEPYEPP